MRTGATLGVVTASALDAAQPAGAASLPTPRAKALMALFGLKYPIFEACHGRATSPGTPRVRYGVRAISGTGRRIRQGSARGGRAGPASVAGVRGPASCHSRSQP